MILVIGQPRTGTSLAMQMLHAAGAMCTGWAPAFEDPRFLAPPFDFRPFGPRDAGKLVWCGLHNNILIPRDAICIRTTRDTRQQVNSEWKFVHMVGLMLPIVPPLSRNDRRRAEQASTKYQKQIATATRLQTTIDIPFETMIETPALAAQAIAETIGFGDAATMAACVRERSVENYPGFLESELLDDLRDSVPLETKSINSSKISKEQ